MKFALYRGRTVESRIPERTTEFFQFTIDLKNDDEQLLSGKWYYQLEPLESRERGAGTFHLQKTNNGVSDLLKGKFKEKQIAEKVQ